MEPKLVERSLEGCSFDLDAAINELSNLSLQHIQQNDVIDVEVPSTLQNLPSDRGEWANLFVNEMMNAVSPDDARARAAMMLDNFQKSITGGTDAQASQALQKENVILKHAVAIQHERLKQCENMKQEMQHSISQYQEQLRTLEMNNYALKIHLKEAQQSNNSIPERFHPHVF